MQKTKYAQRNTKRKTQTTEDINDYIYIYIYIHLNGYACEELQGRGKRKQ